jgi:hypothetical protein
MAEVALTKKRQTSRFEGGSAAFGTGIDASGETDHVRVFGYLIRTVEIQNGAANDFVFTVEGGFRRSDGTIDWYTLATRTDAGGTFSTSAITVSGGAGAIYEVSPTPVTDYIRINVATENANGTDAYVHVEV